MALDDIDSVSEMEHNESVVYDTLGPPTSALPVWANQYAGKSYAPPYLPPPPGLPAMNYVPPAPYNFINDAMSLDSLLIANGADRAETFKSSSG